MNELLKEKDNFYPTPAGLADKLCEIIDEKDFTFLEPSGGKGDLVDAILRRLAGIDPYSYRRRGDSEKSIDVVEIDPDLRGIVKSKYSEDSYNELRENMRFFEDKERMYSSEEGRYVDARTEDEKEIHAQLKYRRNQLNSADVRVVYDDFLDYRTKKHYDCIVMNPPFDRGAEHLLKALQLIENGGGKVICILNQETILNPYTKERMLLQKKLSEMNAEIECLPMEFMSSDSERKTEVSIAVIKVSVEKSNASYKSRILEGLKAAKDEEIDTEAEATAVSEKTGWIDALIEGYEFEVNAGLELYKEYMAIKPYMCVNYDKESYSSDMIYLGCGDRKEFHPNTFIKMVRSKYWHKFFKNPEFSNALTSNLSSTFRDIVNDAANYEFSKYNVLDILSKMETLMMEAREETILTLFEELSNKHSWYEECSQNIHYYSGWKTNKAHKINDSKVILPLNGVYAEKWRSECLDTYHICSTLSDIEKVFDYLAVGSDEYFPPYSLDRQISSASRNGQTKGIELKYFEATFYKKGTCHLKFRENAKELVAKLNIFGSKKKAWLPPSYGKVRYEHLDDEEKAVIDSFQGKEAYEKVLENAGYYLSDVSGDIGSMFLPAC